MGLSSFIIHSFEGRECARRWRVSNRVVEKRSRLKGKASKGNERIGVAGV
jgi:hypothetical protein